MAAPAAEPLIARKVGEGVDRPNGDQELPLDINYQKVVEWLTSRQKLPKDWNKRLQAIQAKSIEESKALPAGLLAGLAGGSDAPLDYFRAVQIRDKLAVASDRTLFGGLAGQAGLWDKIAKAYEKQSVWLAEAGLMLVQAVDYDIPYLRKQQARYNQSMADLERKEADYLKAASACATSYKQECERLGIKGSAVMQELRQLCSELPDLLRAAAQATHDPRIAAATEHYAAWTAFAHASSQSANIATSSSSTGTTSAAAKEVLLPTLAEVREGRTAPPVQATSGRSNANSAAAVAIDWDLGGFGDSFADTVAGPVAVNWDIDVGTSGAAAATAGTADGIDWDFDLSVVHADEDVTTPHAAPEASGPGTAAAEGIDWGIDLTETGTAAAAAATMIDWDVVAEDEAVPQEQQGDPGVSTSGTDTDITNNAAAGASGASPSEPDAVAALRLERDADYRARLLDDLHELRAFLATRKAGLAGSSPDLVLAALPMALQEVDGVTLAGWLGAVDVAVAAFSSPRVRQLTLIASSHRYLDRLVASLQRKAGQEGRMRAAAADTVRRRAEARAALAGVTPKAAETVARTKSIKSAVELAIGSMFSRRVNVLGEINTVLFAST